MLRYLWILVCVVSLSTFGADAPKDVAAALNELVAAAPETRVAIAQKLLGALADTIKNDKKPYARDFAADLSGADAAKQSAAAEKIQGYFKQLQQTNKEQYALMQKALMSDTPETQKSGLDTTVEMIDSFTESVLVDALIEDLSKSDAEAVSAAKKRLQAIGGDAASALADALSDERVAVRRGASEVLLAMGPAAKEGAFNLQFLLNDDFKPARRLAAQVLEALGPEAAEVAEDVAGYLEDEEKSVRKAAAAILKKMGPAAKEAAGDVVGLLTSEEADVRGYAADILQAMGAGVKAALSELADLVDEAGALPEARIQAANLLGGLGKEAKDALPLLKKNVGDGDAKVKAAIEEAIKKIE